MAQQRDRAVRRPPGRQVPRQPGNAGPSDHGVNLAALREIVTVAVRETPYDLEHCSARRLGRRFIVRVVVDGDDGIDLDGVADLSRAISEALDRAESEGQDIVPGEYDLEVGSPGVDRPLTTPRHWRRNIGRLVAVRVDGRPVTARVVAVDDVGVTLDESGTILRVEPGRLGRGKVQVEFSRPTGSGDDDGDVDNNVATSADGIDDEGEDEE